MTQTVVAVAGTGEHSEIAAPDQKFFVGILAEESCGFAVVELVAVAVEYFSEVVVAVAAVSVITPEPEHWTGHPDLRLPQAGDENQLPHCEC